MSFAWIYLFWTLALFAAWRGSRVGAVALTLIAIVQTAVLFASHVTDKLNLSF